MVWAPSKQSFLCTMSIADCIKKDRSMRHRVVRCNAIGVLQRPLGCSNRQLRC